MKIIFSILLATFEFASIAQTNTTVYEMPSAGGERIFESGETPVRLRGKVIGVEQAGVIVQEYVISTERMVDRIKPTLDRKGRPMVNLGGSRAGGVDVYETEVKKAGKLVFLNTKDPLRKGDEINTMAQPTTTATVAGKQYRAFNHGSPKMSRVVISSTVETATNSAPKTPNLQKPQ